jgi:hypothetical protein
MSRRILRWAIIIAVLAGGSYPITHEMYARAAVERTMINSLDANDAAALRQWPGGIDSFISVLRERCLRTHNREGSACQQYQRDP